MIKSNRYGLALLTSVYVCAQVDRYVFAILMEPIKSDLGLTDAEMGLLAGFALSAFFAAAGLPIGRLADRVDRRWLISVSVVTWSAMTAFCGAAQSFGQLLVARMGVGVGEAGCVPASQSLISDTFPLTQRSLALAVFGTGGALGVMAGSALGGMLEPAIGWRAAFFAVSAPGVVLALMVQLTLPEPARIAETCGRRADGGFRSLLCSPGFGALILSGGLSSLSTLGILQWLPAFYGRSFGLGRAAIGGALALVQGAGFVGGMLLGGFVANRMTVRNAAWPFRQVIGVLLLWLPLQLGALLAGEVLVSFALSFLSLLMAAAAYAPLMTIVQTVATPGTRATAAAMLTVASALIGTGGGTFFVGLVSDAVSARFGSESLRWALVIVSTFGGTATLLGFAIAARKLSRLDIFTQTIPA